MAKLDGKLAALATMSPAQLRDEWLRVHSTLPPRIAPDLLARGIAYRLQQKAHGVLPVAVSKKLAALSAGHPTIAADPAHAIRPGARLVRTWHGRTIEVVVLEKGFLFDEQHYPSLTAIARAVTGAAWSGPRFFGLTTHE